MKYESETENGIVHLWDLPEKRVYVRLKNDYKLKLIKCIREYFNGLKDLSIELGLPLRGRYPTLVRAFIEKKSSTFFVVKKFSEFLLSKGLGEFSLNEIEKNIEYITTKASSRVIKYPKFPINFNTKEGALIISAILHDGSINTKEEASYCNTNSKLCFRFANTIKNTIGKIEPTISYPSKNSKILGEKAKESFLRVQYPTIMGLILKTLGLKSGKKILTNPKAPHFIFNSHEEIIAEYLAQAIADDGCVHKTTKAMSFISISLSIDVSHISEKLREKIKQNHIAKYASNIIKDDKKLFETLGAKVNGPRFFRECYYKEKNKCLHQWKIVVSDWKSLNLLLRKIKIPVDYKQRNLERAVKYFIPRHLVWLKTINDLEGTITTRSFRLKLNLTYEQSRGVLRWLYYVGFLNKTYFRDDKNILLAKYNFTEKGRKEILSILPRM